MNRLNGMKQPIRGEPALNEGRELWRVFALSLKFEDYFKPKKREFKAKFAHRVFTSFTHGRPLNNGCPPYGGVCILTHLCLSCAFLVLCGCTHLYKPVYIPTKCNIPKLERPALGSSLLLENIKALLIYTELLEKDLEFCRQGNK
ncbi:hypothetical protein [Helicobacter salomonis]|uniref:hypothetical protein n=1 Tax=Helicobacter salomonis TaxID=56878 RepID=UPI002D78519C|nr:hypothetical protein [Helicobacter salomonis]